MRFFFGETISRNGGFFGYLFTWNTLTTDFLQQNVIGFVLVCVGFAAADVSHLDSGYDYHQTYPAFDEEPLMENLHAHLDISDEDIVPMAPLDDFVGIVGTTKGLEDTSFHEVSHDAVHYSELDVHSADIPVISSDEKSTTPENIPTTEEQHECLDIESENIVGDPDKIEEPLEAAEEVNSLIMNKL